MPTTISIELPTCGYYTEEELTRKLYSYALSLVMPANNRFATEEDEEKEILRRIEKRKNGGKTIPHEEVVELVMSEL